MCGIAGIWQRQGQAVSEELLSDMRDTMLERGPDDFGNWIAGPIGLAHRRLSIIDLSLLGHQPMIDEETGSVIVYNGEVYNYQEIKRQLQEEGLRFKSRSDTEVVLKAYRKWGISCVNKFIGMFSFAIWDKALNGLYLARDRMGIKPLFYYADDNIFMFASRLGALMEHPLCPRDIDSEGLSLYLELGFIPAPWSILKGVKKLNPGHTLWIDKKEQKEVCYWSLDTIKPDPALDKAPVEELTQRLDALLSESVRLRLISDVPLGAFLSGGVDSSLIVALMRKYSSIAPKTFTIGFKESLYDESSYAKRIAGYLGVQHNLRIMRSGDLLALLEDNTMGYDEPMADPSSLPTLMVSRFARESVKVCLSGDGGDELFLGYHIYPILSYLQYFRFLPQSMRYFIGGSFSKISSRKYAIIGQALAKRDLIASFAFMRGTMGAFSRKTLLDEDSLSSEELFRRRSAKFPSIDQVSIASRLDAAYYLADDVLQKVDIASMHHGLEARVPVLDHRIVEFSQSLPTRLKLRGINGKWLLKQVLAKYVPTGFFQRPKRGFVAPIDRWFRGELREMVQDELSPDRIKKFGYLKAEGVLRLINLHLSGRCDTHQLLWSLLCLMRWDECYR
jgi:asparagine synthase (glutamine-hydrolysing)